MKNPRYSSTSITISLNTTELQKIEAAASEIKSHLGLKRVSKDDVIGAMIRAVLRPDLIVDAYTIRQYELESYELINK